MRPKLTKEIVNERLADREIRLVGEFTGTLNKSLFTCKKRHTWEAKPGSVTRGSGCPHCAGLAPLTKEIVNKRIVARGISLVGDFKNVATKTLFGCSQQHTWEAKPGYVMQGTGCPHCAGLAPLTKAIVSERIADREILLLGDFTNTKTKTLFECKRKHTWEARPSTVMAGHGCPFCAGRTQP